MRNQSKVNQMKKRSKIILSSVLAIGLTGSIVAYAKNGHHGFHMKERLTEKLQLDDTQSNQLDSLIETMKTTKMAFKSSETVKLDDIFSLLDADKLNQEEAMVMVRQKLAEVEEHAEIMIASTATFTDSLSADQRATLKKMAKDRSENHRRRHKRGDHNYGQKHQKMEQGETE